MTTQTQTKTDSNVKRKDVYQEVTDTIVKQLEKGVIPWQKPWNDESNFNFDLPVNHSTTNKYRGINILMLWAAAQENNFPSNEWATFKQWKEKDEAVRSDEKGTMIVYYDTIEREEEGEIKKIPFLKHSYVFNRSQLASFDPTTFQSPNIETPLVQRLENVDQFILNTQAVVKNGASKAFYSPGRDYIEMPKAKQFIDTGNCTATEGYYSTLLHELTHWTGHQTRLDRNHGKRFGDKAYAVEELVAEFGAAFLCTEFGIGRPEKEHQASYISNWSQALKENKYVLMAAASDASKASEYLHKLQPE